MENNKQIENILPLRAHHLLCSVLYEGKGYSDEFTNNMTKIVNMLLLEATNVSLQNTPDLICSSCPNLCDDGRCGLDTKKENIGTCNKEIKDLDTIIADFFHFELGKVSSKKELYSTIKENITEEFFESCCCSCRWYQLGICSYSAYIKRINNFL